MGKWLFLCLGAKWGNSFSLAFPLSFPPAHSSAGRCAWVGLSQTLPRPHRGSGAPHQQPGSDPVSCTASPGCRKTCPLPWSYFAVRYVFIIWDQILSLHFCIFLWLDNLLLVYRSDSAVCRNLAHSECPEVLEDDPSMFICVGPSGVTSILISFASVYVMLISIWWACIQGGYTTTDG